ncbi:MAG: sigma-70 family RNA polymerase sigma factor [Oscillospiraceae bacterium]
MTREIFMQNVLDCETTMYHIAKSILINEKDCEDAVQSTILKGFEKLEGLKEEQYFKTWLIRILLNECYSFKRREKPTEIYEEYFADTAADSGFLEGRDYSPLYRAITELKPKIRIVIVLFYLEEYSLKEIKALLKIPEGTVKSRLAKGRSQLREALENQEVHYEQF